MEKDSRIASKFKQRTWSEVKSNDSWSIFKIMGEFVEDTLVGVFSRFVNLFTNKMLGESFNTMRSRYQRWLINIIAGQFDVGHCGVLEHMSAV